MTNYNSVNIKVSDSKLGKLKLARKNMTEITLRLPSIIIGNANDEIKFPQKLLLNKRYVTKFCST